MMIVRLAEVKEKCSVSVTYMFTNNTNADSLCLFFFYLFIKWKSDKDGKMCDFKYKSLQK